MADDFEVVCGECGRVTIVNISDALRDELREEARRAAKAAVPDAIRSETQRNLLKRSLNRHERKRQGGRAC